MSDNDERLPFELKFPGHWIQAKDREDARPVESAIEHAVDAFVEAAAVLDLIEELRQSDFPLPDAQAAMARRKEIWKELQPQDYEDGFTPEKFEALSVEVEQRFL